VNNFKKALIISPNYKLRKGGIASVISLYKKYLKEKFIYTPSIYFQNIILSSILFPINLLEISFRLFTKPSIKIVHIHGSHGGSFYRKYIIFWLSKKIFKKQVIYHLHSSDFKIFYRKASKGIKLKINYLINNSNVIIVLSEEWRDYILNNFNPKKIKILENIVEKQKHHLGCNKSDKLILLFLGRIGDRKGIFDLLEVISNLNNSHKNRLELYIGGDGEIDKLKKVIKNQNLNNVHFVGWVKDTQKTELLNKCDVFVLPSYNEGLPISLLEALSFGKPIISTSIGGIPRILKNNVNGYLIEPGNEKQLENAIISYLNNKDKVKSHGEEGLTIVKNYYPENVLSKLNNIYEEIL